MVGIVDDDALRRAALACAIQALIGRMWLEAEKPWGADATGFWTEDGIFTIEGLVEARGRDGIRKVGAYRETIGPRVSRHIMSNYVFEDPDVDGKVRGRAVMTHFGGTGEPPLPLELPVGIYDVSMVLAVQPDGALLIEEWRMRPAFLAKNHPAIGMPGGQTRSDEARDVR